MADLQGAFIQKSENVHGKLYDYSEVIYKNNKHPVCIICKRHGKFLQLPIHHVRGSGCPLCKANKHADSRRMSVSEFIQRSNITHNNCYLYGEICFTNQRSLISIECPAHGSFSQTVGSHLSGSGCPECAKTRGAKKNTKQPEDFIKAVCKIYPSNLDFTATVYKGWNEAITVVCSSHGGFRTTPASMMRGRGCPSCNKEANSIRTRKTQMRFLRDAVDVHGERYDYSGAEYISSHVKLSIFCKSCQEVFTQTPASHLSGVGCPSCAKYGFDPSSPSVFYLIGCDSVSGSFTGYGITKNILQRTGKHIRSLSKSAFVITQQHTWDFPIGSSALALENAVKKQFPQTSRLGCDIEGFKRESTDAPFEQVKEFIESILKENPEWQLI